MDSDQVFSLDNVRIASPCRSGWSGMVGDDKVRFCQSCQLNVYNLSAMTRNEAEALIAAREGRLCARYYRRFDGTILTSDCSVGVKTLEKIRRGIKLVLAGVAAILIGKGFACGLRWSVTSVQGNLFTLASPEIVEAGRKDSFSQKMLAMDEGGSGVS